MLNMISIKMYKSITIWLLVVIIAMGVGMWLDSKTILGLNHDIEGLKKEQKESHGRLVLSQANERVLAAHINSQNKEVEALRINLDMSKKQYRVKEKRIYETIFSERVVLKDLTDAEDCNNTKRIVDEIINLKL